MEQATVKPAPVGEKRTRDLLIDAVRSLMIARNSTEVSFSDISETSGVNSALIRYHFGNKLGLLKALLERDTGPSYAEMARLVAMDIPAEDKLRRHIAGAIETYFRFPYMNRLVHALTVGDDEAGGRFISERFTRPLADAHRAILTQGVAEGVFRAVDPMLFYFSLIGACDHLFYARHSLKYAFDVEEITDDLRRRYTAHVTDMLFDGVRLSPGAVVRGPGETDDRVGAEA